MSAVSDSGNHSRSFWPGPPAHDATGPASGRLGFLAALALAALALAALGLYLSLALHQNSLTPALIPFATALMLIAGGVLLLRLRAHQPTALMVAALCFIQSIVTAGLLDRDTAQTLIPLWLLATVALGACFGLLALHYPTRDRRLYSRPLLGYTPLIAGALLAGATLWLHTRPSASAIDASGVALAAALVGLAVFTVRLVWSRRYSATPALRARCNIVLVGMLIAAVPLLLWVVNLLTRPLLGSEAPALDLMPAALFLALPALSLVYAVFQSHAADTDRLLSRTVTYGLLLAALIAAFFLLVSGISLLAGKVVGANDAPVMALVVFAVTMLFWPARERLQRRIDRLYFRQRVDFGGQAEAFSHELAAIEKTPDIFTAYREYIERALNPEHVLVFLPDPQTGDYAAAGDAQPATDLRFDRDSTFIARLSHDDCLYLEPGQPWPNELIIERERLLILRPLVLLALPGSGRLNGFVAVGAPRSGAGVYDYEQLQFLRNLTRQVGVVIERARVIEALDRRVHELGVLTQVGQAVNFTLEFDDLLELISTQANRLVQATHFYIVLRDETADELYFAFYLEDDERYREQENRRWSPGRDLFSEVIRTGQPLNLPDYGRALAERVVTPHTGDERISGWMAVPLVTGQRTLGVMTAATSQPGHRFTDDQLRGFIDIAALAATAIDKARLFTETNQRARQLTALNEVSRQLVAIELDLEKLLTLITETAVGILDAEAGALLLVTDDERRDLEFRVATGVESALLIGRRVAAGQGVAGAVAQTGEAVIVNDAANDPRWRGDLADSFQTRALLAVPLVAQNQVIGVLEVLNRRDGLPFREDDINLLTTFAGQAAVAIENARLFQMTDFQLSQRVAELEAMERVDVELNRSLDLTTVAEITVRYAMEYSGASGGLLGLLNEGDLRMTIVGERGEPLADSERNRAEGFWSVEHGLVRRVLHTRRAELVADVREDRDYDVASATPISQMAAPMMSGGQVTAVLLLEANREPRFNLAHLAYVQRLAEHASVAIANALLYAELERANQSKSEFVSFVAHELKNPLTSVKGYSDILISGAVGGLSDQQRTFLMTIRANADRMNTLVSDLNDVTKLQTNNMQIISRPMAFMPVIEETLRPLQRLIEDKGQQVALDVPEDLPLVMGDENRLIQVLTNLVSNAHKYTPDGGTITISAQIEAGQQDAGPMLHVSVADTGIGMSEEDLAKLFTPYFRSSNPLAREQPGTGLGLTITGGLIEQHGGEIRVESIVGHGTTFHFTVPLAE